MFFEVLSLPPMVAPTKVLIVPLSANTVFDAHVEEVCTCGFWDLRMVD
jgi:glycyl-tRNA synthetase (class II)